jgi:hypothetical protein
MRYSMQLEKMTKRPLLLAFITAFAVGCSDTEAEFITQKDKSATMQNPTSTKNDQFQSRVVEIQLADSNANPSSSESHSDSNMAAENWDNTDGPDTHAVAPSNDVSMAAEKWRRLEQTVSHSNMAAENWNNPEGPDMHAVQPSDDDGMAAENWRETR